MQTNKKYRHRKCRGRPPSRAKSREGPVKFKLPDLNRDFGIESSLVIPEASIFRRRGKDPVSAGILKLKAFKWKLTTAFRRSFSFHKCLARDWITDTCSVSSNKNQNRYNNKLREVVEPAEICRRGGICLFPFRKKGKYQKYFPVC